MSNKEEPKISESMLNELKEVNSLLDKALFKAKEMENSYRAFQTSDKYQNNNDSDNLDQEIEDSEQKVVKPSNWDQLKSIALDDSISTLEDDKPELAENTKEVRKVKPKSKKLKIDDNWEDDPY